jgi:hypothetical protein
VSKAGDIATRLLEERKRTQHQQQERAAQEAELQRTLSSLGATTVIEEGDEDDADTDSDTDSHANRYSVQPAHTRSMLIHDDMIQYEKPGALAAVPTPAQAEAHAAATNSPVYIYDKRKFHLELNLIRI